MHRRIRVRRRRRPPGRRRDLETARAERTRIRQLEHAARRPVGPVVASARGLPQLEQFTLERSSDETHVQLAHTVRDEGDDSFLDLIVHLNLSDIDRDAQELRRIDAALLRIQEGTFGYCSDCDQEIPWERLRAEPTAVRCVRCQELYERTHVSPSTPTM